MSFSVGIVGLPNVGKSTLFKAITKKQVDISAYPFCTIEPNHGVVAVPDRRLDKLTEVLKPEKKTQTTIEFVDIAGLVKNAHQGEGLGNQFLAQIREVDLILEVVRVFDEQNIVHVHGRINPEEDIETIKLELVMKDLETLRKYGETLKDKTKSGDAKAIKLYELLQVLENWLNKGNLASSILNPQNYQEIFRNFQLLTAKPIIYVLNNKSGQNSSALGYLSAASTNFVTLDLKLETEMAELSQEETKELNLPTSSLDQLIKICYDTLNLITFYTAAGGKEIRAWTAQENTPIKEAAGKIHTDFAEKFIRAEVINWQKLVECRSWHIAREKGLLRTEGKDYKMQDGDVVEIKI